MPQLLHALVLTVFAALSCGTVAWAAERFTAEQVRVDVDALAAGISATHPDVSHSVDPARLALALEALRQTPRDAMDRDAVWRALATLNPLLADGHLFVGHADWRADTARHLGTGGTLFPFEVAVDVDGRVRIVAELGSLASHHADVQPMINKLQDVAFCRFLDSGHRIKVYESFIQRQIYSLFQRIGLPFTPEKKVGFTQVDIYVEPNIVVEILGDCHFYFGEIDNYSKAKKTILNMTGYKTFYCTDGFLKVQDNKARLLASIQKAIDKSKNKERKGGEVEVKVELG